MRRPLLSLLLLALLLTGCDEAVDPFLEQTRYFTLYGTLDMARDTQFVRVIPIDQSFEEEALQQPIRFTSTDLTLGETTTWTDSLITFADGSVGHVFYAPLRLIEGHRYRLIARMEERPEQTSTVETRVPSRPTAEVLEPDLQGGFSGLGYGTQDVIWDGLGRRPFRTEVWYRFLNASGTTVGTGYQDVRLPLTPDQAFLDDDRFRVRMDLRRQRLLLDSLAFSGAGTPNPTRLPLAGLGLRMTVLDDQFEPVGNIFSAEIQIQPDVLSNVDQGFGFVGSVGRFSVEWMVSDEVIERLRYKPMEDFFQLRGPQHTVQGWALEADS